MRGKTVSAVIICVMLCALILPVRNARAAAEPLHTEAYEELLTAGFSEQYASMLEEVLLAHPAWTFLPLCTALYAPGYTWDFCVGQETADPQTNLIPAADMYAAYRHPSNQNLYDAGYYQASPAAVSYFMDPRNFLNEADLFQFLDLSYADIPEETIEELLAGSFMSRRTLENGLTFAQTFIEAGRQAGVNPLYLAVKALQEQGREGTSAVISGRCGTWLYENAPETEQDRDSLLSFDGCYNLFNIGASGNGVYAIYLHAMERAKSQGWDSISRSVEGGALLLKESYIDRYQSTLYLQKFNVDARSVTPAGTSRNFWSQYAQNVADALSQSRNLYAMLASTDDLDLSYTFLIPVYPDMPKTACPDPANGSCPSLAPATARYSFSSSIGATEAEGKAVRTDLGTFDRGNLPFLEGRAVHSYGVTAVQYRLEGQADWMDLTLTEGGSFSLPAEDVFAGPGSATVYLRIRSGLDISSQNKHNLYALCAVVRYAVRQISVRLTVECEGSVTEQTASAGDTIELPSAKAPDGFLAAGWKIVSGKETSFLPQNASYRLKADTEIHAVFIPEPDMLMLPGASVSLSGPLRIRFEAAISYRSLEDLSESPVRCLFGVVTSFGDASVFTELPSGKASAGKNYRVSRIVVSPPDAGTSVCARACVRVCYSDGTYCDYLSPVSEDNVRTAAQIAAAALADDTNQFTEQQKRFLASLLP
ncbi:MAG: hypothetical protein IJR83_01955 [Clostridia bacterium]|nr:hypothetical protein [Clostridia bacterium]